MIKKCLVLLGASLFLLLSSQAIFGGVIYQPNTETKLTASDGAADDRFGHSAAISGDIVVVGAYLDDDNGIESGSVYIFQRSGTTWIEQQKLTANDGSENDQFGRSVAINGDTVFIGATRDDDNGIESGSVYIFQRSGTTWIEQQKLTASDGSESDHFGACFAINGDTVVIGTPLDDENGIIFSGSVYIFQRSGTTWIEQQKLTVSGSIEGQAFGSSVAISGDGNTIFVGAPHDDDKGTDSGSVYIFQRSGTTWIEQQKLTASDGVTGDVFGNSVAASGDTIFVGAHGDDDNGIESGSVYIFQRSGTTWIEQQKLTASDGATIDQFGLPIAINGDTAIVGAWKDDDKGTDSGSVYIFQRSGTTWIEQQKLTASDGATDDVFGLSIAINGDTGVIGTPLDDDKGTNSGSVYIFQKSAPVGVSDFEDFEPDDQGKRFGVDLDETYAGLDWAYNSNSKINTWGSFTVQDSNAPEGNDSNGTSIPGAGGSDNWLKARASSVGKGAKITRLPGECFEFKSMKLFTQDHPAFIDEVTVTWRTCDALTTTFAGVVLTDDTWIEKTAADLGIEGVLLRAMWFNGAPTNPNAAKFGLDDFDVSIVPEP